MIAIRIPQIYLFFFIGLTISACKQGKGPDVNNIPVEVKIERFDQDIDLLTKDSLAKSAILLRNKYGIFYDDFMSGILQVGSTGDTSYYKNLQTVLHNPDYNALREEVKKVFPDMSKQNEELSQAFKYVKYYFPQQKIPRVISFFSGFAVQVPVGNEYIGIGLDMFLGANSKFYPALRQSIPQYISRRFTPDHITPRVMETFVREDMFPEPDSLNTLLDRMIYNGKIMYLLNKFLPDVADSVLMGYSREQQQWAQQYEAQVWGYFLEENLLYETDYMKVQKYLSEAPFTPGLGNAQQSSPKLAIYCGWQIVEHFMAEHRELSLQALMKNTNYQEILTESHYKPK